MDEFVVDCSLTMAWCFADEQDVEAESILRRFPSIAAWVPSIWPLEVANCLLKGERRLRITSADSARFVALLGTLPISIDEETNARAFREILALARTYQLSAYDAAYLECASRRGLALATLDSRLREAARTHGIATHPDV
jgi:predicted nucleic acid-binding protein